MTLAGESQRRALSKTPSRVARRVLSTADTRRLAVSLGFGKRSFHPRASLPRELRFSKKAPRPSRRRQAGSRKKSMVMDDSAMAVENGAAAGGGGATGAPSRGDTIWCEECEDVAASLK